MSGLLALPLRAGSSGDSSQPADLMDSAVRSRPVFLAAVDF